MWKFIVGILLSLVFLLSPVALIMYALMTQPLFSPISIACYIGAAVILVIYLCIARKLRNLVADGRQAIEYDEYGRNKRLGQFKHLSREQQKAIDLQKIADMERILNSSVLEKFTKKGSENPEADLDKMIGLLPVKNKVKEMAARMKFEKQNNKKAKRKDRVNSMSGRHMVFYGNAGTGKTTTARIIAGFLYKYGYLKQNKVIEVDGNFLKSAENTPVKIKMVVQAAFGGVLFIDEAYILCDGAYGDEAVATLIKEMEDNRDKFICILAGYTKDMDRLLNSNTGFKSRIKEYIDFPDYSIQEMQDIFVSMSNAQGFVVGEEALAHLETRLAKEKNLKTFGNGRTVRNILDEAIDKHSLNIVSGELQQIDRYRISGIDVSTAIKRTGIT